MAEAKGGNHTVGGCGNSNVIRAPSLKRGKTEETKLSEKVNPLNSILKYFNKWDGDGELETWNRLQFANF